MRKNIFGRVNNFPECFSLLLTPLTKVVSEAQKYCTNEKKVTISSALLVAKENNYCSLYYNDCYIRENFTKFNKTFLLTL